MNTMKTPLSVSAVHPVGKLPGEFPLSPRKMDELDPKIVETLKGFLAQHETTPVHYHLKDVWWRVANVALGCFQNMTLVRIFIHEPAYKYL
jgi:hypothetical protein